MANPLRFGICTDQNQPFPKLLPRWRLYEELGFDSLWDCEFILDQPRDDQLPVLERVASDVIPRLRA